MSAEDLGRRLVGEVKSQRLDELLTTLSLLHVPHPPTFNIPPLDNLISIFRSQPTSTTGFSTPNPPILEFSSPTPSQGPLHLLYFLTAVSILPRAYGGNEGLICVIDTESSFCISQQIRILRHKLRLHNPELPVGEMVKVIEEALRHIHIFKPDSISQLLATISSVPEYFLSATHPSMRRSVSAILIPDYTSFHYEDRATTDVRGSSLYPDIIAAIKLCARKLRTPVICASWNLGTTTLGWSFRPQIQADVCLVIRRIRRKFTPSVCAEEVLGMKKERQREGTGGKEVLRFEVRVNGWGSEGWDSRVGDALRRDGDGFFFRCEGDGVVVEG